MLRRIIETKKQGLLVLPYVSLCEEKASQLQTLASAFGKEVFKCYGSHRIGRTLPGSEYALIVCTIEKANALVTRMIEDEALERLCIVVADEIHMVGDPNRGYLLELLMTKLKHSVMSGVAGDIRYGGEIQLVGMSATLPNVDQIASWLQAELFISKERPVPLEHLVLVGSELKNRNLESVREIDALPKKDGIEIEDDDMIGALSWEVVSHDHSVLIFCPTKRSCEQTAEKLAKLLDIQANKKLREIRETIVLEISQFSTTRQDLLECIKSGVAYHHAGLSPEERSGVEKAYRSGACRILTATSTLAAGVNLPARRVIFKEAKVGMNVLDPTRYKQMAGRAGRAGIDSLGESVLVETDGVKEDKLKDIINGEDTPIKSCLELGQGKSSRRDCTLSRTMTRSMLEAISSGLVCTTEDVKQYLQCTFLSATCCSNSDFKHKVVEPGKKSLEWLCKMKYVEWKHDNDIYEATALGKAVGVSGLSPDEGRMIFQDLKKAREGFVMANDLHMAYLITPILGVNIKLDWGVYYRIIQNFNKLDSKVMENVGVKMLFIQQKSQGLTRGSAKNNIEQERVATRLYGALILRDLMEEKNVGEVASDFKVSASHVHSLQDLSSMFASMNSVMCERLGFSDMEALINKFQSRVSFGGRADIISLAEIPGLKNFRARILYKNNIRSPEDVVDVGSVGQLASILFRETKRSGKNEAISYQIEKRAAKSILKGAKELLQSRARELRKQADLYTNFSTQQQDTRSSKDLKSGVEKEHKKGLEEVESVEDLSDIQKQVEKCSALSFLLHTRQRDRDNGGEELLALTLCLSSRSVLYLPLLDIDPVSEGEDDSSSFNEKVWQILIFILGNENIKKATWNLKAQLKVLKAACKSRRLQWTDVNILECYDVRVAAWLLEPDDSEIVGDSIDCKRFKPIGVLVELLRKYYSEHATQSLYSRIRLDNKQRGGVGKRVDTCRRVACLFDLFDPLFKRLVKEELLDCFTKIEMPLVPILAEMEMVGVPFNSAEYQSALDPMRDRVKRLSQKAWKQASPGQINPPAFNLGSPSEISRILFQKLKLPPPPGSKIKSGNFSTRAEVLEMLDHPLARTILEFRQLTKLIHTMQNALPAVERQSSSQIMVSCSLTDSSGRLVQMYRIKGTFLQTTSTSGRLHMDEPNLQCVPNPKDIDVGVSQGVSQDVGNNAKRRTIQVNPRSAFRTIDEYVILSADYSQLELRIMAHFSQDPVLLKSIRSDQDFFSSLAAHWQDVKLGDVTSEMRTQAKRLTYGILYGMGALSLSEKLECDVATAEKQAGDFKARLGGVSNWMKAVIRDVENHGWIQTVGGRKRYFHDFVVKDKKSISPSTRAQVERQAINTICQGSAADIVKTAMINIHRRLRQEERLRERCHMVLEIHDELLFEVRKTYLEEAATLIATEMEGAWKDLKVPLQVKLKVGDSWGSIKPFNHTPK